MVQERGSGRNDEFLMISATDPVLRHAR